MGRPARVVVVLSVLVAVFATGLAHPAGLVIHAEGGAVARWPAHRTRMVGQSGGGVGGMAFAADGRRLWMAEGPRLVAVDLGDAARPVRLGRSPVQDGLLGAIAPGPRFVAALVHGASSAQVAFFAPDPTKPEVLGRVAVPAHARQIAIVASPEEGDRVVLTAADRLLTIDARDPRSPGPVRQDEASRFGAPPHIAAHGEELVVLGDDLRVFTVGASGRLRARAHQARDGGVSLCSTGLGIAVVVRDEWRLEVSLLDVGDPSRPAPRASWVVPVGSYPRQVAAACSATGLLLTGTAPSAAGANQRFAIAYDLVEGERGQVEAPAPIALPELELGPLGPSHLVLGASAVVLARPFGELDVLAREGAGYAEPVPLHQPVGYVGRIAVRGSLAALAARDGSVRLVSLANANAPRLLSIVRGRGTCCYEAPEVAWQGSVLWVAGGRGRLQAWDLREPSSPVPLHDIGLRWGATDLLVAGDRVIVAEGEAGVAVFTPARAPDADVRTWPSVPGHAIFGMAMHHEVLWLSEDTGLRGVLRALKVPEIGSLSLLGELPATVAHDVTTLGDLVVLTGARGGASSHVVVLDASDPGSPKAIGEIDVAGPGRFATIVEGTHERDGERLVLATEGHGLSVLDLHVPRFPDESAMLATPGDALDAVVDGDLVWLADGAGGLVTVHIGDSLARRAWLPLLGGSRSNQDLGRVADTP